MKLVNNLRKTNVFEGFEALREGQVWPKLGPHDGPKMGPSWGKMGSGSELDGIFGHLRTKMAVKLVLRRKMLKNLRKTYVFRAQEGKRSLQDFGEHSGDGGRLN